MKKSSAKTHLFNDCPYFFEDLLESFNEKYSKSLIVKGNGAVKSFGLIEVDLLKYESINPFKLNKYKKLLSHLENPLIDIRCFNDYSLVYDCKIYFIDSSRFKGYYMLQKNFFPSLSNFKFHLWSLDSQRILEYDRHWL
jgi:hypothetical protein|tara:strand:- start:145 stop:561 length:417 start_codon:yes stop_codon:yes gene_type:complete